MERTATTELLAEAIAAERRVTITYKGADELRELSPYELRPERVGWAHRPVTADLVAWDHGRDQYRTFKLASIDTAALLDAAARPVE